MFPVPHLTTVRRDILFPIEKVILRQVTNIESWFRLQWEATPAPITSSVDLRHAGFKLVPVDTNLFPAGFNNLNPDFLPLCIQAFQAEMMEYNPRCKKILVIPESHTRNQFYFQSLSVLKTILIQAGFDVRIGSIDPELDSSFTATALNGETFVIEPVRRIDSKVALPDFQPCMLLLNNDLSTGQPPILDNLDQLIRPNPALGWTNRLKSNHFSYYNEIVSSFCLHVGLDPWLINPYFVAVEGVDFMAHEGLDEAAKAVDELLSKIKLKYEQYEIQEKPYVVVKADNGTYGMSVMMIHEAQELKQMNRKQRTRMNASKGSQKVDKIIIQEGVYSLETMEDGSVAEPVVYMIGQYVVGGFYRVHRDKAPNENLNAPGMHFEPLAFAQPCNMPRDDLDPFEYPNRFYAYGVIARLAALAAAKEIAAAGGE